MDCYVIESDTGGGFGFTSGRVCMMSGKGGNHEPCAEICAAHCFFWFFFANPKKNQ